MHFIRRFVYRGDFQQVTIATKKAHSGMPSVLPTTHIEGKRLLYLYAAGDDGIEAVESGLISFFIVCTTHLSGVCTTFEANIAISSLITS